jgi:hypothetical protein
MTTLKLILAVLFCWLASSPGQFSSKEEVTALAESFDIDGRRKDGRE